MTDEMNEQVVSEEWNRYVAIGAIRKLLSRDPDPYFDEYAVTPIFDCPECGCAVADAVQHDRWHAVLANFIEVIPHEPPAGRTETLGADTPRDAK